MLDRLLEEDLSLGWVSGTSAGAVNAVAMASGLAVGGAGEKGRSEARAALKNVWEAVMAAGVSDLVRLNPFFFGLARGAGLSSMGGILSPYDFNPLGFDPLRKLLSANIDFERLRFEKAAGVELLIAATEVSSGRPRIFRRAEMTVEVVLASACLPQIHHAVEIDGRAYWDGGFSANPDVLTLAAESPVEDTLIVQLNPLDRAIQPRAARDIAAQVSTITFNQPLYRDIEMIVAAQAEFGGRSWLTRGNGRLARIGRHRFHIVDAGRHTSSLAADTKSTPERTMLEKLFRAGRMEAARWLERNRAQIGRRQTVDLAAHYLRRDRTRAPVVDETPHDAPHDAPSPEPQPGSNI